MKKKTNIKGLQQLLITCIIFLFICSNIATNVHSDNKIQHKSYDDISLSFSFERPSIEKIDYNGNIYDELTIPGLLNSFDLNKPRLPVKSVKILIPYGQKVSSIQVEGFEKTILGYGFKVDVGKNIIPIANKVVDQKYNKKPVDISKEDLYSIVGTHSIRGYNVLYVNLYPVQYKQKFGIIQYYKQMNINIRTTKTNDGSVIRGLPEDEGLVRRIVYNPSHISSYNNVKKSVAKDTVKYAIITNEYLEGSTGDYTFQDLIQSKIDKGVSADIFTVEDIESNPDFWVDGQWGDNNPGNPFYGNDISSDPELFNDTQAKIRNFIRYAYSELETDYVLLGGDADVAVPNDNIIPLRGLYATEEGLPLNGEHLDFEEDDIPSDIYYACLDGNFNYDMDDHWGENETYNDAGDIDEADLLSEVYVGRACVDSYDEVSNFVMKTLSYEDEDDDPYLAKALMVGEYLGFPGVSQYGGNYKDLIIPYIPDDIFDVDTLYERDGSWSKYTLMNILNDETPHLLNHLGHGNRNYALKMYNSDIVTLTNNKFFFIYSQTCLAGSFDNWQPWGGYQTEDSAAEHFTVETPHGAFAVIMNARYGLGSENTLYSPSQTIDESFFKALFTENLRHLGQANHFSKEEHIWHINENGIRWVYYETNLFGDPELQIKPVIDDQPPITTLTYTGDPGDNDWYIGSGDVVLSAYDADSSVDETYYKIDNGEWTLYTGPFAYDEEGTNIISYYSVDSEGNVEDVQTDIVKIDLSIPTVFLTKQEISDGEFEFCAHITDDVSGADYAEFYLDDELEYTDYDSPFEWIWGGTGRHSFQAIGYDIAGNLGESNIIAKSNLYESNLKNIYEILQKNIQQIQQTLI